MAGELESLLKRLEECRDDRFIRDAPAVVKSITEFFDEEMTKSDLDLAFAVVFSEKNGIIAFLRKILNDVRFKDVVTEIFLLLGSLLENFDERLTTYVCNIKNVCLSCLCSVMTAVEKNRSLEVLRNILKSRIWQQNLNIPGVSKTLENCYQNVPPTVQQNILHLLGIIAHQYPELTDAKKLLLRYIHIIKEQKVTNKLSFPLIIGCLNGLEEYLHNFELSLESDITSTEEIHEFLKLIIAKDYPKRVAQRAALSVIELHGAQFAHFLYKEHIWWHETLLRWLHMSDKDRKAGLRTIEVFYCQIAVILCEETTEGGQAVFQYYMNYFHATLASQSSSAVRRTVIKGFGDFSKPCKVYMTEDNLEEMFNFILHCAENIYINLSINESSTTFVKEIWHLPQHLESLAKIFLQLENVQYSQVLSLQHIAVVLVWIFPQAYDSNTYSIIRAMQTFFCSLYLSKSMFLNDVVRVVVYQGIIRTCSHSLLIDMELQKEQQKDGRKIITYKNYLPLWKILLTAQSYKIAGLKTEVKLKIVEKLHTELIKVVLHCVKKLNLNTRKKPRLEIDGCNIVDGELEAVNANDFRLFINLTGFCQDIFPRIDSNLFKYWFDEFSSQIIVESLQFPLVSGFYKLLDISMQICDKLQYFGENLLLDQSREQSYSTIVKFLRDVTKRVKQYKGDLLVSCLQLLLSSPVIIIYPILREASEIFPIVFKMTNTALELGHKAMDSLEKWVKDLPPEETVVLITVALPHMEPFLQCKSSDVEKDMELQLLETERRWHQHQHGRRIRSIKHSHSELPQTELVKLQWRILHFLGSLNSDIAPSILGSCSFEESVGLGHTKYLKLALPFKDMRPVIYLDKLIPRIADLALNSGDRKTRVAACETLHAIVMLMLGLGHQEDEEPKLELFRKIITCVLKLGCDTDQIVWQLFHPLALQIIHWYSSKFQYRSKYCVVVVEIIMDGITHPTDSAIREFCCKCLREFVCWSVKQLKPKELEESPFSIEAVIKRICFLCTHPSFSKRLGASLAFNSIYTKLREEKAIVDQFWFQLLYYMVKNLSLADQDDVLVGITKEVTGSIDHIERVLKEKAHIFNKANGSRRKPPEFEDTMLVDAVMWLLKQCSSVQKDCRMKAMDLVTSLVPFIPGANNITEFLQRIVSDKGIEFIKNLCEVDGKLKLMADLRNLHIVKRWLAVLTASIDCYSWFLQNQILSPSVLFHGQSDRIFRCISFFIKHFGQIDTPHLGNINLGPSEMERYKKFKCATIESLLTFLTIIFHSGKAEKIMPPELFNKETWEYVVLLLFQPSAVGFDSSYTEEERSFQRKMAEFLQMLKITLPGSCLNELITLLSVSSAGWRRILLENLDTVIKEDTITVVQKDMCQAISVLIKSGLLKDVIQESTHCSFSKEIFSKLFSALMTEDGSTKVAVNLQPASKMYTKSLVELAFLENIDVEGVVELLLHGPKVYVTEKGLYVRLGEHILSQLQEALFEGLLGTGAEALCTMDLLLSSLGDNTSACPLRILEQLMQYSANRNPKLLPSVSDAIAQRLFSHWNLLKSWSNVRECRKWQVISLLTQATRLLQTPVGCLANSDIACWLHQLLRMEDLSLQDMNKILELLPCISVPGVDAADNSQTNLWSTLLKIKYNHFPILTSELQEGSINKANFVACFHKLLSCLEISGSILLLKAVVVFSAGDRNHICNQNIKKTLPPFMKRLTSGNQLKALNVVYSIFCERQYDSDTRLGSISSFAVPLLYSADGTVVEQFFAENILKILDDLSQSIDESNIFLARHGIVTNLGSCQLTQALFFKCSKESLENESCPITTMAFPGEKKMGKDLFKEFIRRLRSFRTMELASCKTSMETLELFHKLQCAAYNTLIAIVSNVCFEKKFIYGFLFMENKDMIWEKLVDCHKHVALAIDWEIVPERRRLLVALRQKNPTMKEDNQFSQPVHYLYSDSQYLLQSSLAEDVTQFDFTKAAVRNGGPQSSLAEPLEGTTVTLELDAINSHECMPTICGLLQNMLHAGIIPRPQCEEEIILPDWMDTLRNCLLSDRHRNIKIFILKVILNNENIFSLYAKFWIYPILYVIDNGCLGNEINYFITDLLSMLLSWSTFAVPIPNSAEKEYASKVFKFLILYAPHRRRDIMKHNLEVIKTYVELWKNSVDIPYTLILEILKRQYHSEQDSEYSLQLVGIICCNNMLPWNEETKAEFMTTVLQKIVANSREVYLPCAEVIGMVLKLLNKKEDRSHQDELFLCSVKKQLNSMSYKSFDKYLSCLHGIQKHYNAVLDESIMHNVIVNMKKCQGIYKALSLEIILSGIKVNGEIDYRFLERNGLLDFLDQPNPSTQLAALCIIEKLLSLTSDTCGLCPIPVEEMRILLDKICHVATRPSVASYCRSLAFQILADSAVHHQRAHSVLVRGLMDSEPDIREFVLRFWCTDGQLPSETPNRLIHIMQNLYTSEAEHHFLGYALQIMLETCKTSPDYNINIFPNPLHECKFEDYKILVSWRAQNLSMAPLFAETLASQMSGSLLDETPQIRATRTFLDFLPTLVTGRHTYDETFRGHTSSLFSAGVTRRTYAEQQSSSGDKEDMAEQKPAAVNLRRRFLRDEKKIGYFFAKKEVKRASRLKDLREERTKKAGEVLLYRSYRKGDLPDIEIPYSCFIKPLQALAKMDAVLGRQLFVSLSVGIMQDIGCREDFTGNIKNAVNTILQNTISCPSMLIGSIIEIALTNPNTIIIDMENLTTVCKARKMYSPGCLLLEEYLINDDSAVEFLPEKRRKGPAEPHAVCWLHLAELYEGIGDLDSIRGIFLHCGNANLCEALAYQAESNWKKAQLKFQEAIKDTSCDYVKDYCYASYFKCLAHLSCWEALNAQIKEQINNEYNQVWGDEWCEQKMLPLLFTGQIHFMLMGRDCAEFCECVDNWLFDSKKTSHLVEYLSEELSLLHIIKKDFVRAKVHADQTLSCFLRDWSQISPVSYRQKEAKLMDLQRIVGVLQYLEFLNDSNMEDKMFKARSLAKQWTSDLPSQTSSFLDWEQKLLYRRYFSGKICEILSSHYDSEELSGLHKNEIAFDLAIIDLALKKQNFYAAQKYIRASKPKLEKYMDESVTIQHLLDEGRCKWLKAMSIDDVVERFKLMSIVIESTAKLKNQSKENHCTSLLISVCTDLCCYSEEIFKLFKCSKNILSPRTKEGLHQLLRCFDVSSDLYESPEESVLQFGFHSALEAVETADYLLSSSVEFKKHEKVLAETHLRLAQYCYYNGRDNGTALHESHLVISILRAMKHGSAEARQLFPCLLQLPHLPTDHMELFKHECSSVPEWMFLGWVSQILACLNTPVGRVLDDLVIKLAQMYPQALVYQFHLTVEMLSTDGQSDNNQFAETIISRLKSILLSDPLIEAFMNAFSWLCLPQMMLEERLKKLIPYLQGSKGNLEKFKYEFKKLISELYTPRILAQSRSAFCGEIFREIDKFWKNSERASSSKQKECDGDNNLENIMQEADKGNFTKALKILTEIIIPQCRKEVSYKRRRLILKDFSPWLSEFQADRWNSELEIPGQYTGDVCPQPQQHIKISAFLSEVDVISSMRKPLKVTILGNDAREHRCLVKYGEDLRLDQRIQQIFSLMGKILAKDPACKERHLFIKTYQVVPLSSRFGFIQWVDNTKSLRELAENSYTQEERKIANETRERYSSWIQKPSKNKQITSYGEMYGIACSFYSKEDTEKKFRENVNSIPWDILRRAIWDVSASPEIFFTKRHRFASSYAVMCICHWLLGVGDRHISNCLVLPRSGLCLGIDFGSAFGAATQFLQVPELMPFRLTPHIINIMQPHKTAGVLEETMIHTLRALRSNHEVLLATMEVFVQEPLLDWLDFANRHSDEVEDRREWFPRQKVALAKRKFEGANPAAVTEEELRNGQNKFLVHYLKVLWDAIPQTTKREDLSPQEQVKFLMAQATDLHILGKTWCGWEPWF